MKQNLATLYFLILLLLAGGVTAQEEESYTRVLDKLTSVSHFSDRPVLFIIGFDTSKSMSIEFDRSKQIIQTILSRYAAPGDSIFIFGFADKPDVLKETTSPLEIETTAPDKQLASINESLLSLARSSAHGTLFGRAKLYALERAKEFGSTQNTVVLLFSDNHSELEMGLNERARLKELEAEVATTAETIPLHSAGVSSLWLTLYTNSFPNPKNLLGPDGESDLDNPRLAWAARRVGSQTLQFIAPAGSQVESGEVEVVIQFLGSSEPQSATITVDGKNRMDTVFEDGRATWSLQDLKPGPHLLFAQAVLADGKIRNAEKNITVSAVPAQTPTPTPSQTVIPPPAPSSKGPNSFPFIPFFLLLLSAIVIYFFSLKSIKIRVIGPDKEESFMLAKGKSVRLGGSHRVESDLVFEAERLKETVAGVRCLSFGKAKVFANSKLRSGSVEVETDEGFSVGETAEPLLTSATVTFTDERGHKHVFTLVKEDASRPRAEDAEHFSSGGEETSNDGGDWRS